MQGLPVAKRRREGVKPFESIGFIMSVLLRRNLGRCFLIGVFYRGEGIVTANKYSKKKNPKLTAQNQNAPSRNVCNWGRGAHNSFLAGLN